MVIYDIFCRDMLYSLLPSGGKGLFAAPITTHVIASQSADWRGDPPDFPETLGDCHVASLLAMTCFFLSAQKNFNFYDKNTTPGGGGVSYQRMMQPPSAVASRVVP